MIEEVVGDLWTHPAEYRVVPTNGDLKANGELVMGRGVALDAKKKFPLLAGELGKWVKTFGNYPHIFPAYKIISFPTKRTWKMDSDPVLIAKSAESLLKLVKEHRIKSVALPRVGCGIGTIGNMDLNWDLVVKPILEKAFGKDGGRFVVVLQSPTSQE